MATSIQDLYFAIPTISRYWISIVVLAAVATRFTKVDLFLYCFNATMIYEKFQFWRLITNFLFFGYPSFPWLMKMYMLYNFVPALENDPVPSGGGPHRGNVADFAFLIVFGMVCLNIAAYFTEALFLGDALYCMIIYIWSKRHPEENVTFYMFRFQSKYISLVMLLFAFIVGDDVVSQLLGIGVGHLYYFLQEVLPNDPASPLQGYKLLHTPDIFYQLFSAQPTHAAAVYMNMRARDQQAAAAAAGVGNIQNHRERRTFTGAGNVLGR
jgi:Derlin-2/3